jgi:ribosomal protein L24E
MMIECEYCGKKFVGGHGGSGKVLSVNRFCSDRCGELSELKEDAARKLAYAGKLEEYHEEKAKWDSMSDTEKDMANSTAERNSRIAFTVIVLVAATIASGYFSEWNNVIMIITFCVLAGVSFKFWSIIGRVVRGIVIASFCSGIGGLVGFIIGQIAGWQWEEASGKAVTIICAVAGFALGVYGGIKFRASAEPAKPIDSKPIRARDIFH